MDQDCPILNEMGNEKRMEMVGAEEKDTETVDAPLGAPLKELQCIASTECPLVEGFTGYCNVDRGNFDNGNIDRR